MGLFFDVGLHLGTLIAILIYFREEWIELLQRLWDRLRHFEWRPQSDTELLDAILIGTVPAVIVGGLFADRIEHYFRHPAVTVVTLVLFGAILWWGERRGSRSRLLPRITAWDGLIIGTAQVLALVPGVSRSGITIAAALFLGFARSDSAKFSFLLATPIIALAAAKEALDVFVLHIPFEVLPLLVGIFFSVLSGFFCVKYFLRFLQSRGYLPFVIYRWILAGTILFLLLLS